MPVRVALAYLLIFQQSFVPAGLLLKEAHADTGATIGVTMQVSGPPADITDLTATAAGTETGSITLTWTEPGATSFAGTAQQYIIRYSIAGNIADNAAFNAATPYTDRVITPGPAGSVRNEVITGLCPTNTYAWAIEAKNASSQTDNWARTATRNQNNFTAPLNMGPPAVTNLTALTGDTLVHLSWTPTNICDFGKYRILKSTNTPPSTTLTDILTQSTTDYVDNAVTNGTTYYYIVQTFDTISLSSSTAVLTAVPNASSLPNQPVIISTATLALSNSQIQIAWNDTTPPSITSFNLVNADNNTLLVAGLAPSTTFYIFTVGANDYRNVQVQAVNGVGVTNSNPAVKVFSLANPPTGTSVVAVTATTIQLQWNSNSNLGTPTYQVVSAFDNAFTLGVATATTTATGITLSGLMPNKTYFIHVQALNGNLIPTAFDITVSAQTSAGNSTNIRPAPPGALTATLQNNGTSVALTWHPVTKNEDGTSLAAGEQVDYLVNVSNDPAVLSDATDWSPTVTTSNTSYVVNVTNGTPYYIAVRSRKPVISLQSRWSSMIYRTSDNTYLPPSDDQVAATYLMTPAGNQALTFEENNTDSDWLLRATVQDASTAGQNVVTAADYRLYRTNDLKQVSPVVFPNSLVHLGFQVQSGSVIKTSPSFKNAFSPVVDASKAQRELTIFWFNGSTWIKVGGNVDIVNNDVTYSTGRIGQFEIRDSERLGDVTLVQVYPRIITPNGDGFNDVAIFQFGESTLTGLDIQGEVFDVTGAKVADLKPGPDPSTTLMWDGKDNSGRTVRSGIYIYQIMIQGSRISGSVVVAR